MGAILSRWRKQPSTIEILEKLDKEIDVIEKLKRGNLETQRKIIGSLLLYSVLLYILSACVFYFYYFPTEWKHKVLYSAPLLVFPLLIYALKRFLHWYFVKRITRNDTALEDLHEKKKTILEEVMEKETYKKAKEILERFDPEKHRKLMNPDGTPMRPQSPEGQELRRRSRGLGPGPVGTPAQHGPNASRVEAIASPGPGGMNRTLPSQAATPLNASGVRTDPPSHRNGQHSFRIATPAPGPPMPRPVLPRERTTTDRLMELLIGDGPQNRYALICNECQSHNGMALREEFEFISYRCCYCFTFNPSRKQKPQAPRIEKSFNAAPSSGDKQQDDSKLSDDEDSLLSNDSESEKPSGQGQSQGQPSAAAGGHKRSH